MTSGPAAPSGQPGDEVVIVGGGPAGMLLAYLLVQGGERVHVIERHPDFSREFRGEGIQASVVKLLRELDLLDVLFASGIAVPARAARVFLGERPVATLQGVNGEADFGIILHQAAFLGFLHGRLSRSELYRATFSVSASSFVHEDGVVRGIQVREGTEQRLIRGRSFVVAAGRGTALRKQLGIEASSIGTHFNILWLRLPTPRDPSLVPDGFRAYLTGDALFILYSTADGQLQLAWSRRDEEGLTDRDFDQKKRRILLDAPPPLRAYLDENFQRETVTAYLNVQSDRASRWFKDGVLFVGDAAHTMSPVAGQGINLAMRDAVVAANHILAARAQGRDLDSGRAAAFQAEREPEVIEMQAFQRRLGYFMLGAPRWQVHAFFRLVLPLLGVLGIRDRLLRRMQGGVTEVSFRPPALEAP